MFDRAYLQAFRADALAGIKVYCAGLNKHRQRLSQRQIKDIAPLKEALGRGYFQTQDAVFAVKNCLQQMPTGFWMFQPGRLHLKRRIQAVVVRYEMLSVKRAAYQQTGAAIHQEVSQAMPIQTNPLQEELIGLKGAYQRLKTGYETLRLANHALSAGLARVCLIAQHNRELRTERKLFEGLVLKTRSVPKKRGSTFA